MRPLLLGLGAILIWASSSEAACTGSSPTWTSTPDLTSVSSCVSSASRGDTINVTAGDGTETWTSALTLTKGVSLIGPGRDSLIIDRSDTIISIQPDTTAQLNEETIKVTGFTFNGNDAAMTHMLLATGAPYNGTKPFKHLVLGNNRFKNISSGRAIWINGQTRGVIYNNNFDRVPIPISPFGNNTRQEWELGNYPFAFGNADNLFFEDNSFTCSSTYTVDPPGWTESGQGGRVVMRYNTWDFTNCTNQSETWDMHGFQNYTGTPSWPDDGQSGTMISEYYGNTLTKKAGYRWVAFRGSWGLLFNNLVTGTSGSTMNIMQYDRGCKSYVWSARSPLNGEINNTYGFNNTMNGTAVNWTLYPPTGTPGVGSSLNNTCPPVENTGFWNYNGACTSSACAAGIGRGTTPPTGTCTIGTGYWVASTPTPTVDPGVIQNGALYKCTSPNAWVLYYKPYIYPHPLRSGSGTKTKYPPAPSGLTIY